VQPVGLVKVVTGSHLQSPGQLFFMQVAVEAVAVEYVAMVATAVEAVAL
jgi:hypothetical protein